MAGKVKFTLEADEAKAVKGFMRVVEAQKKSGEQFAKTTGQLKKQGRGFLDSSFKLRLFAGGLISVTAAVGFLTKALQEMSAERKRGLEGLKAGELPLSKLIQLSGGDMSRFKKDIEDVKKTMRESGMTKEKAAELQFQLGSLGLRKERRLFSDISSIAEPAELATVIGTLKTAFGDVFGTIREGINQVTEASIATKATIPQIGGVAARFAQQAKMTGTSPEETLAVAAILAKGAESPEVGGTLAKSFVTALISKGILGKGMIGGFEEIEKRRLGPTELKEFLGRTEAVTAYGLIQENLETLKALKQSITEAKTATGTPAGLVTGMLAIMGQVPEIAGPRKLRQAKRRLQLAEEKAFGGAQGRRDILRRELVAEMVETQKPGMARVGVRAGMGLMDVMGVDPGETRGGRDRSQQFQEALTQTLSEVIAELARRGILGGAGALLAPDKKKGRDNLSEAGNHLRIAADLLQVKGEEKKGSPNRQSE